MEIKNIKHIINKIIKRLTIILKEIKTLPNAWLYVILSVILTFTFFIFTFPYSTLIRNQLQTMGENIGRSAYIGEVDFSFFGDTDINNITIILKDGSEINLNNINLDIGIFSVLLKNTVNGNAQINNIKYEKDKTSINMVAKSDFDLRLSSISEFPANGRIKLDMQNIIANGITVKGFDIPPVRFTSITANAGIIKKKITIESFNASGPDIKGSISGTIMLAQSFPQSQLNLNIVIDSSSSFLENYRILLNKWIDSSNKIQLTIRGSISNPNIDALEQKNEAGSNPGSSGINARPESGGDPGTDWMEKKNGRRPIVDPPVKPEVNRQFTPVADPVNEDNIEEPE
ncbi:MAG: type II secretion system protein GspN [Spirochaetes bacterium]|nr:type II secretion system protein GspN [Spirochaetota bacterium]